MTSPALAAALAGALGAAAPAATGPNTSIADLPGWAAEDHAAAFRAFREACGAARDPAMAKVCLTAQASPPLAEPAAKAFFEDHFQADPASAAGVLTAYFAPVYEARHAPDGEFTAALRGKPADLATTAPYPDRATIEAAPASDALAWMRPEDLFFLQVQGSGVVTFADGKRKKAVFAATNGRPYLAIGGPMAKQGLLTGEISADAIHAWLAAHRGPEADAMMRLNPRYVFFRLVRDDGRPPSGSAHTPLPPGRALAVDTAFHALGELFWIDADKPIIAGARPSYRRVALALDTGGAIRGPARADLFLGLGAAAGTEAGKVHHRLKLWRLVPK